MKTEIAPALIMTKLEQFDYAGATAVALIFLLISFALCSASIFYNIGRGKPRIKEGYHGWNCTRAVPAAKRNSPSSPAAAEKPWVKWTFISLAGLVLLWLIVASHYSDVRSA